MSSSSSATTPQLTVNPATNRITTSGFSYDANGNATVDPLGSYTFDAENRMVQSVSGGVTTSYTYDAKNLRMKKGTTTYIYSGNQVIAEYVSGTLSKEYIYSGGRLLATIAGSAVTYHHADHLSNRLETNASGTVTRTFCTLPFGDIWYETGTADKWKFTTYERDSESGADYAINRYYTSRYGRFFSVDPLSGNLVNPQSLNRYAYVVDDPINAIDPDGLDRCNFNIKINNKAGLDDDQLAEIEARINAIFGATPTANGDTVGAVFTLSGKSDYTLNIIKGSPNDNPGITIITPTIRAAAILHDYPGHFGIAAGTAGAHELVHRMLLMFDQKYTDTPNLMNFDSAVEQKKANPNMNIPGLNTDDINPVVQGFASLNSDQVAKLFKKCQKKHPGKSGGGGGHGPLRNVPPDTGGGFGGGFGSGTGGIDDPCPNGDCGPGSGWDPSYVPTLHPRG